MPNPSRSFRVALVCLAGFLPWAATAHAQVRVKDITTVAGEHPNQLVGLGLVTGLAGTGGQNLSTKQLAINLMERLGVRVDGQLRERINSIREQTQNLSVVVVSATLPPHAKPGQQIDVIVSTFDNASSLQGGTLVFTPLTGADGEVYATAAGPISTGGFSFSGQAATLSKNHPTTGRIPNGAIVEQTVPTSIVQDGAFRLLLTAPDFETARRIAGAVDAAQADAAAIVLDPATVRVAIPRPWSGRPHEFIAQIGNLEVMPDVVAKVVINERTGTVVVGEHVKLSQVLITHANLIVSTTETPQVSQPAPFSPQGQTAVVPRTQVDVREDGSPVNVIGATATVGDLARALNMLGVTPRDLSSIFQQLKASGALHAELEFK